MTTETDLRELLHDLADEAPQQCTSVSVRARNPRRFVLPVSAAAAVVLMIAGVVSAAANWGSAAGHARRPAAASARSARPAPTPTLGPKPTVVPTAAQRHRLTKMGLYNAKINGERHPTVYVVWTTFHRAYTLRPEAFGLGSEAKEARQFKLASTNSGVWIFWSLGDFGHGNTVMADLVNARDLKGGLGTFVAMAEASDPTAELAPLGEVVKLT